MAGFEVAGNAGSMLPACRRGRLLVFVGYRGDGLAIMGTQIAGGHNGGAPAAPWARVVEVIGQQVGDAGVVGTSVRDAVSEIMTLFKRGYRFTQRTP